MNIYIPNSTVPMNRPTGYVRCT